jgi:hypothetical protein
MTGSASSTRFVLRNVATLRGRFYANGARLWPDPVFDRIAGRSQFCAALQISFFKSNINNTL